MHVAGPGKSAFLESKNPLESNFEQFVFGAKFLKSGLEQFFLRAIFLLRAI